MARMVKVAVVKVFHLENLVVLPSFFIGDSNLQYVL